MRTMPAGRFKATCLAVMDEVAARREPVVVTKHGRPVAKLVPMDLAEGEDRLASFKFPGKITFHGDVNAPLYTDEELEEFFERTVRQINGEDL